MKVGIEVEGRFTGVPTLFCDAAHYLEGIKVAKEQGLSHIYISDNDNTIDPCAEVLANCGLLVTLDVTKVLTSHERPLNVTLMLRLDGFPMVNALNTRDQVKFEQERNVLVAPVTAFYRTVPSDFDGDREL